VTNGVNTTKHMKILWLLQLSDSALPIGAMNQSFGLENLVAEESLNSDQLETFLSDYLSEVGGFECLFCAAAYRLGAKSEAEFHVRQWLDLNVKFSAFKLARETRVASATLGRRFLGLVSNVSNPSQSEILSTALEAARQTGVEIHHSVAFGLAGATLGIDEEATLLGYLHQTLTNLVSACQRLLPLGQNQATRMLWELKPVLAALVTEISDHEFDLNEVACFAPLLEVGSMRHPSLPTRLFIS
jgi:urease accessory protein